MTLLLQYTIIFAAVLSLVALGGCFSEHSGVINLGLEGIMVMGALGGALAMNMLDPNSPAIVIIAFGVIYSVLLGVASINFKADQTLIGTAMNLLATAAATVFVRARNVAINPDNVSSSLSYINQKKSLLVYINGFEFNWFMLFALVALIISYIVLYKTRFGLRLQACGENPQAADSVGINVYKMRWAGVLISGLLGGLGGIVYITAGVSEWKFDERTDRRPHPAGLYLPGNGSRDGHLQSGMRRSLPYLYRHHHGIGDRGGSGRRQPRVVSNVFRKIEL